MSEEPWIHVIGSFSSSLLSPSFVNVGTVESIMSGDEEKESMVMIVTNNGDDCHKQW